MEVPVVHADLRWMRFCRYVQMFSVCHAVNARCIVVAGQMREFVLLAALDCSLCHVWFVGKILSAGVGAQGKLTRSVRPNRFVCCGAVTTSFVRCSSSHRHIQNAECVTAFSTSMAPFIQTFVGLWIIFFARQERDTRESCMIDAIGGKNQIGRKIGKNYRYPTTLLVAPEFM